MITTAADTTTAITPPIAVNDEIALVIELNTLSGE